jgi:hypothetical protein
MGLQQSAAPVMDDVVWFHNYVMIIITLITLFVLALLIVVMVKFNARANPEPSRTTHNTGLEVAWTLVPVLILVAIAVPSFKLLFLQTNTPPAELTVKATGKQWYAHWQCDDETSRPTAHIPTNCATNDLVVMTVSFPQCWNGKDLDSPDHRSHMAYPEDNGCPRSHPIGIPEITFKVFYKVPSSGTAGWRLSSDMYDASLPGGYSAHADWFDAWDPEVVQAFVKHCDNPRMDCHSHLIGDGRAMY